MIHLDSLKIERFRGILAGELTGLSDVNILLGQNNSGKSTVAEGIARLAASQVQGAPHFLGRDPISPWTSIRNEVGPAVSTMWYNLDSSKNISISAQVSRSRSNSDFSQVITEVISPGAIGVQQGFSRPRDPNEPSIEVMSFLAGAGSFTALDTRNPAIENTLWPRLVSKRKDKLLTKALNLVFDLESEGFQYLPPTQLGGGFSTGWGQGMGSAQSGTLIVLFSDQGLPLDSQGDGTRAAIRTLMVLSALEKTLFILEEPECHQHPASLERFAYTLCKQSKEQQVQLIVSTHSVECVRAFLKGCEKVQSEGAVFHLSLNDGLLDAKRFSADSVQTLDATGLDVRFVDNYA